MKVAFPKWNSGYITKGYPWRGCSLIKVSRRETNAYFYHDWVHLSLRRFASHRPKNQNGRVK